MKRIITATIAVLIIGAGIVAAIPFLVSSKTVRSGITSKIEALTGREVTFKGNPSLSFNPFLGFEISDLELVDPKQTEAGSPLLRVEKVKAQLDLLPILSGKVAITEYQFLRPRIVLKTYSNGNENWNFETGGLSQAIQTKSDNRSNQTTDAIPKFNIGDLVIKDGILIYEDEIAGTSETITSINGKVSWPDANSSINISGNGIWRGEGITTNTNIANPIEILSGGESPLNVELKSQPLKFVFDGQANMFANLFVKGDLTANTPSISRLAEVMEIDIGGFSSFENWSTAGKFEATANNTNISDATFNIGDSNATGVIRVSSNELGQSKLDGTLAFETIDLAEYITSFEPTKANEIRPNFIDGLNVDLRVSSQSINTGFINLAKVAAAINIDQEGWTFDIGDASAFNGKLVAKLGERLSTDKRQAFLDISVSGMDAENISELLGRNLIGINGETSFVANIRTNKLENGILNSGLNGSFSGDFKSGSIIGMDLPAMLTAPVDEDESNDNIFNSTSSTAFKEMKIKLFLNNGIAAVSQSTIQTNDDTRIQIIGDVNLYEGKLDLQLQEVNEDGPKASRLFINGTTENPVVKLQNNQSPVNQN